MEVLTGHTREELVGAPFKKYFTDPLRAEDGIRSVLREGRVTNYELTARAKDGMETGNGFDYHHRQRSASSVVQLRGRADVWLCGP